ncbi:MAG: hypothetical protein J6A90_06350 [Clostridia bacterium]|nr:hypothetical protein [Clostridia bacterium]
MNRNEQETTKKPKKRFNIFDWYYRNGKNNDKADINALKTPSVVNFFKLVWFKLNKLFTANIIFAIGNFPVVFLLIAISGMFDKYSYSPVSLSWGPFQAAIQNTENYASSALIGIHGLHNSTQVYSIATIIFFALSLLTIFTWGFTKVGTTYIYRNIMSGDPVFPLSDFFYIIKRNIKQSLIIGALDFIILGFLLYDIVFLFRNSENTFNLFMMFLTAAMLLFYFFIRPYIYIMIFTFDLSIGKIIKNACSFAILGIKRNLMALLGCGILLAFNIGLAFIFAPIGIVLPFIITIALFDFIGVYAAYPNIIKYMMNEEDARAIVERTPIKDDFEDEYDDAETDSLENGDISENDAIGEN